MRRSLLAVLLALAPVPLHGQDMPPIGIIDFYGLRALPESTARAALGIRIGDTIGSSAAPRSRLRALPGVADAQLNFACCSDDGKVILFVGVAESGAPVNVFNAAPTGSVRLPDGLVRLRAMFDDTLMSAVRQGKASERDSAGHAFFEHPALSAIQHRLLGIAAAQLPLLRDVVQHSANAEHRATAAQILGYAPNVGDVVPDLERAIHDPDETVRNNAMRALAVIALYAQQLPSAGIRVSPAPFIDMLNSVIWTDRNKSSLALYQLTTGRDSALLAALRANAVPALRDIARWRSPGHAFAGFMVLGRVEGIPEQALQQAWQKGDRSVVLGSPAKSQPNGIARTFLSFGRPYGGWLLMAFDSIPASQYGFHPTPVQQSVGFIAQHLETANYGLCSTFGGEKYVPAAKDLVADTIKARWPKDTLIARVRKSLEFCAAAIQKLSDAQLSDTLMATTPSGPQPVLRARFLMLLITDLAEHYAQVSGYMRILGMVPPSALPPRGGSDTSFRDADSARAPWPQARDL